MEDAVRIDGDRIHLDLAGFSISCANPIVGPCGSGDADGVEAVGDAYEGLRAGLGLDLSVQVSFRGNTLTNNAAGGVSSGVNLGANLCTGPNVLSATCP